MVRPPRQHWTNRKILEELRPIIKEYGRMPSAREIRSADRNDLACAISRHGGFRCWAQRCGVSLKKSETQLGQDVEEQIADILKSSGFDVQRKSTKSPFDLLVNGYRVDVKSAHYSSYRHPRGHSVEGWIFHLAKVPPTCDVYLLVCLGEQTFHKRRYVVPSSSAMIQTITITNHGKYERFRDNFELFSK